MLDILGIRELRYVYTYPTYTCKMLRSDQVYHMQYEAGLTSRENMWEFWKISMGELEILKLIKF